MRTRLLASAKSQLQPKKRRRFGAIFEHIETTCSFLRMSNTGMLEENLSSMAYLKTFSAWAKERMRKADMTELPDRMVVGLLDS